MKTFVLPFLAVVIILSFGMFSKCTQHNPEAEEEINYAALRKSMVENQLIARGITDPVITEAFLKVPRHVFLPKALREKSYTDENIPLGSDHTLFRPYLAATLIKAIAPSKKNKILEVEIGTGYISAVLSQIVGEVYSIETSKSSYDRAYIAMEQLGYHNIFLQWSETENEGWPQNAPYDGIIIASPVKKIPENLIRQMKVGAIMAVPVEKEKGKDTKTTLLVLVTKKDEENHYGTKTVGDIEIAPVSHLRKK